MLRSAARLFGAVATADPAIDAEIQMEIGPTKEAESGFGRLCRRWIGCHDDSRCPGYLKHPRLMMPSLADIYPEPRQAAHIDVHNPIFDYEEAIPRTERVCECVVCNILPSSATSTPLSLSLIVKSVIILLWALSPMKFDRCLRLSRIGVQHIYQEREQEIGADRHHSRQRLGRLSRYSTAGGHRRGPFHRLTRHLYLCSSVRDRLYPLLLWRLCLS